VLLLAIVVIIRGLVFLGLVSLFILFLGLVVAVPLGLLGSAPPAATAAAAAARAVRGPRLRALLVAIEGFFAMVFARRIRFGVRRLLCLVVYKVAGNNFLFRRRELLRRGVGLFGMLACPADVCSN